MADLGLMYAHGQGVLQDYDQVPSIMIRVAAVPIS
jgi:TPR repeat protein